MIGVILAGGSGSRLRPLTSVTNKHLLPVHDKPMIYYPMEFLKELGMKDIILTTGKEHGGDFTELLGDGSRFGVDFTYKVQEGALGIAYALGITHNVVKEDSMIVILGDNIFLCDEKELAEIRKKVDDFTKKPDGAIVFLKEVDDPERFGVAELDKKGNVLGIEEKPAKPKSNYAVTGLYIYDKTVFDKIKKLKPSGRGELELTDVNNAYIKEGKLKYHIIRGSWTDAGTFESLHKASLLSKAISDKKKG